MKKVSLTRLQTLILKRIQEGPQNRCVSFVYNYIMMNVYFIILVNHIGYSINITLNSFQDLSLLQHDLKYEILKQACLSEDRFRMTVVKLMDFGSRHHS